jgi:hypothetical protein
MNEYERVIFVKRFFKISLYILLVIIFTNITWNIFIPRPIKFENFKTAEEAELYLNERYPIGTDINNILNDLSSVGAKCIQRSEKIPKHQMTLKIDGDYEKVFECSYYNNFFSLDPISMYDFSLYVDKEKLVGIFVKKKEILEMP